MSRVLLRAERRFLTPEILQEDARSISGYAAKFNRLSQDLGGFKERIAYGAFTRAVGQDVRLLVNHEPSLILGRTTSRTLNLAEDSVGLRFAATLPDTSYARDLLESIRRGDVSQCSFSFITRDDSWDEEPDEDGVICNVRTLRDCDLLDVSVVTYPAYEDTEVEANSRNPMNLFPEGLPVEMRHRLTRTALATTGGPQAIARRKALLRAAIL